MGKIITDPKLIKPVQDDLEGKKTGKDDVGWSYVTRNGAPIRRSATDESPIREVHVGDEVWVYVLFMGYCKGTVCESKYGLNIETKGCICDLTYDEDDQCWCSSSAVNKRSICKVKTT